MADVQTRVNKMDAFNAVLFLLAGLVFMVAGLGWIGHVFRSAYYARYGFQSPYIVAMIQGSAAAAGCGGLMALAGAIGLAGFRSFGSAMGSFAATLMIICVAPAASADWLIGAFYAFGGVPILLFLGRVMAQPKLIERVKPNEIGFPGLNLAVSHASAVLGFLGVLRIVAGVGAATAQHWAYPLGIAVCLLGGLASIRTRPVLARAGLTPRWWFDNAGRLAFAVYFLCRIFVPARSLL